MGGHVITIAQQKGGSGKTTLAAHLAVAAQEAGLRVALIDSDPQGSLGRWYMTRLEAQDGDPRGLKLSTSSAWGVKLETGLLKADHDLVIIDTPPKIDTDLRPALRESDLVIAPVASSQVDLWATEGVIDLADRQDAPVLAVLNRVRKNTRLADEMEAGMAELGCTVAKSVLSNRVAFAESLGKGKTASELQKSGAAAQEVRALLDEVRTHLR